MGCRLGCLLYRYWRWTGVVSVWEICFWKRKGQGFFLVMGRSAVAFHICTWMDVNSNGCFVKPLSWTFFGGARLFKFYYTLCLFLFTVLVFFKPYVRWNYISINLTVREYDYTTVGRVVLYLLRKSTVVVALLRKIVWWFWFVEEVCGCVMLVRQLNQLPSHLPSTRLLQ